MAARTGNSANRGDSHIGKQNCADAGGFDWKGVINRSDLFFRRANSNSNSKSKSNRIE